MHVMQVAGAEVLVTQIIERLSREIEPTVFCLDALGQLGQMLRDQGIPVVVLDRQPGFDRKLVTRFGREIKDRHIQVLHAHQYTPFFYSAMARAVGRHSAKILFTEHGRHYPDIVSWKRRWLNRLFLRRYANVATACCEFSAHAVRTVEGIPQTVTLYNGVDLENLPPRGNELQQRELRSRLGLAPAGFYVACIARFHPVKDHPTLIRAWKQVSAAVPHAKLLLVGDGPEKGAIRALTEQLQLSESIEFWGIRRDVGDILRAVDVFTLTSLSEAASLTLLEAMASQCASVVTEVGGNGEHVSEGVHGYLVPRGDHQQLAKRLVELAHDPELIRRMGQAARERVTQQFDLTGVIQEYARLYRKLAPTASPKE